MGTEISLKTVLGGLTLLLLLTYSLAGKADSRETTSLGVANEPGFVRNPSECGTLTCLETQFSPWQWSSHGYYWTYDYHNGTYWYYHPRHPLLHRIMRRLRR